MDALMLGDAQELAARARTGDREAFGRLFHLVRRRLERAVNDRLGVELRAVLDPDDVLQETALRALRSIEAFEWRGEDSFLRWLAGIAEHILRDQADKQRARHAERPRSRRAAAARPPAPRDGRFHGALYRRQCKRPCPPRCRGGSPPVSSPRMAGDEPERTPERPLMRVVETLGPISVVHP